MMYYGNINCEHPTKDRKGLISEPLDLICVKQDCQSPRYACNHCRGQHSHKDQFISIHKLPNLLQNLKFQIDEESKKADQQAAQILSKKDKLLLISKHLYIKMLKKLEETSEKLRNNHYLQLKNIIESKHIENPKQQIQKLGNILSKITTYEDCQLQIIKTPSEYNLDLNPLRISLEKIVDEFFQQIEQFSIKQTHQIQPPKQNNFIPLQPVFKFQKNMGYYSQIVQEKIVIAQAGTQQVTLITPNLTELESSLLSIKVNFNGGFLSGMNNNRIGLYFGNVDGFNFKYTDANSSQFILVGDQKSIIQQFI